MGQIHGKFERIMGIPDERPTCKKSDLDAPEGHFPFEKLPPLIQHDILGRLTLKDRLRLSPTGRAWRSAARDTIKQIYMRDFSVQLRRKDNSVEDGKIRAGLPRFEFPSSTELREQETLDAFFDLLSELSERLDTLAIPRLVLAYGLYSNQWASLPMMKNVKTIIASVMHEEVTRFPDVLEKFPGADSLVITHWEWREGQYPHGFLANFPTTYQKLNIRGAMKSLLYDLLTRQSNLNWLDLRCQLGNSGQLFPALHELGDRLMTLRLGALGTDGANLPTALSQMVNLVFLDLEGSAHDDAVGDQMLNAVETLGSLQALHLTNFNCSSNALQRLFLNPEIQLKRAILTQCKGADHLAIDALLTGNHGLEGISLQILANSAPSPPDGDEQNYFFAGTDFSAENWSFSFRNLGLLKDLKILRVLVDLGTQSEPFPSDFLVGLRASDHPMLKFAGIVQWDWRAKHSLHHLVWGVLWGTGSWNPPATTAMVRMGHELHQADRIVLPEPQHLVRDGIRAEVRGQGVAIPLEKSEAYCIKTFYTRGACWVCPGVTTFARSY